MKISNHLPHFNEPTLLVVAGSEEATVYLADRDEVRQAGSVKAQRPELPRRALFRLRTEKAREFKPHANPDEEQRFVEVAKQLADKLAAQVAQSSPTGLYLFCPTYLASRLEDALPDQVRKLIEVVFFGNYRHQHPYVLLSKVQEHRRRSEKSTKLEMIPPGALDILNKTGSAV